MLSKENLILLFTNKYMYIAATFRNLLLSSFRHLRNMHLKSFCTFIIQKNINFKKFDLYILETFKPQRLLKFLKN